MSTGSRRVVLIQGGKQGTGVRLGGTNSHYVLTCAHVIGSSALPKVDGKQCKRVVDKTSEKDSDLALLETAPPDGWPLAEAEWLEELAHDAALRVEGFPGGEFDHVKCSARAVGLKRIEVLCGALPGMSGGAAALADDPFALAGLVKRGGDGVVYSELIGAGVIRKFLRGLGVQLKMRGGEESRNVAEYLRLLRESELGFIDARVLKIETAHNPRLEDLYIRLTAMPFAADERGKREARPEPLEAVLRAQRVLIQGEAGSGKSTFLKRVAYELAGGGEGKFADPLPATGLFPIHLRIAHLEEHIRDCKEKRLESPTIRTHPGWVPHFLSKVHKLSSTFFERKLERPDTLLMLDGLDESTQPEERRWTMELIDKLGRLYPQCRMVATTRPRAGVALAGFQQAPIQKLDQEAQEKFLGDWARVLFQNRAEEAATRQKRSILAALSRPEINRMADNPLMLTMLAALHWNRGGRLPEERAKLYEAVLSWLAEARPEQRKQEGGVGSVRCLDLLSELAWGMQTYAGGRKESLHKDDAAELIRSYPPPKKARAFLDAEEVTSGIVVSDTGGAGVTFWHPTFREFLAARHLKTELRWEEEIFRDGGRLYWPEWREVMRLMAGLLSWTKRDALVSLILNDSERLTDKLAERARCVALLSGIAADLKPDDNYRITDQRWVPLTGTMRELFQQREPLGLDAAIRAAAAEAMEEFHAHPLLRLPKDEDYWVEVPGGTYTLGAQQEKKGGANYDPQADPDEHVHTVKLERFAIGRYPVTVHEFLEYVRAGGTAPEHWDEQLVHLSRPVVYVTWHQADAYAKWVAQRERRKVGLPSEDQWEAAARGMEARKYPWGNAPEPGQETANFGMNVGTPTPVGLFPAGNTEAGIADLAGNVWEWTASDYNARSKSVRGGSFSSVGRWLRAACRDGSGPGSGSDYLGFRLVRE